MAITNTKVVNTASKYIVKSTGFGGEKDQIVVDAEVDCINGTDQSKVSLIELNFKRK